MAPAKTGIESSSRNTVTSCDHTNNGILCSVMPGARMLKIVVMKLIAPRIELAPARWSEKIAISTAGPDEPEVDKGAYIVHPVPAPSPVPPETRVEPRSSRNDGTSSQKLMLFMRG